MTRDQAPAPVDRTQRTLADGHPVTEDHREINPATGMQKDYVVLSAEERAKGLVRPVRDAYKHVGTPGPLYPLRDLADEERARYAEHGYAKKEEYPAARAPLTGRYWTQASLDNVGKGCGGVTHMSRPIAETYARDPSFYSGTFCVHCRAHFPVGDDGEFVWYEDDGSLGERVGT